MKTIVIIQARMGSSRLPGKVLQPLGETVVLDYVVTRCRAMRGVNEVIVATSSLSQDDPIAAWCAARETACFRGSEEDVLSRYLDCAAAYTPDYVVRVTADCPFIDYELGERCIAAVQNAGKELLLLQGELPRGLSLEVISYEALRRVGRNGTAPRHREHVTYYAYEHAEQFAAVTVDVPLAIARPELRITLDTEEDYLLCQAVADRFAGQVRVPSEQVVAFLAEHPEIAQLNAHIEQKPVV